MKTINNVGRCIEYHHCKELTNETVPEANRGCNKCEDGFENIDGTCRNYPHCKHRESGICKTCEKGYKLIDGTCIADFFCQTVDDSSKCTKCLNGYEYNENGKKCISCVDGGKCYVNPNQKDNKNGASQIVLLFIVFVITFIF